MAGTRICARIKAALLTVRYQRYLPVVIGGALTWVVLAGRYNMVPGPADPKITTHCLRDSDTRLVDSDPDIRISVPLDSGDRMVISSLDRQIRLHRVRIRQRQPLSPQISDMRGTGQSVVDLAVIRPRSQNLIDINSNSQPDGNVRMLSVAATGISGEGAANTAEENLLVEAPVRKRLFRLPRFLSGPKEHSAIADYSEQVTSCRLAAASNLVCLYTDQLQLPSRATEWLITIIEDAIIAIATEQVGPITDIDGDCRLSVVVCELSENWTDTEIPLSGCVRAADFLAEGPFHGDIIYLDYRLLGSDALPAVVMHEMAHAAVFSQLQRLGDEGHKVGRLPGWMNEAIAHSCEYRTYPASPNLANRISAYLHSPGRWPLILPSISIPEVSGRGPMRAAGLFFIEFLRRTATISEVIDRELLANCQNEQQETKTFGESFRQWTVWMSDRQQRGELPLRIRAVPRTRMPQQFVVRGTAATWWQTNRPGVFKITASHNCALQVTVIKANHRTLNDGSRAER